MDNIEEIKKQISELQSKVDKLENESKEEKKGKRWSARINDTYFFINDYVEVDSCQEYNDDVDNYRYKTRNYFATYEEAEEYQEIIKTYYDLMDLAEELNNGEKINWNDDGQRKYVIHYDCSHDSIVQTLTYICKDLGQIYCLDENFKEKAIEKIGEDRLKKMFTYERS